MLLAFLCMRCLLIPFVLFVCLKLLELFYPYTFVSLSCIFLRCTYLLVLFFFLHCSLIYLFLVKICFQGTGIGLQEEILRLTCSKHNHVFHTLALSFMLDHTFTRKSLGQRPKHLGKASAALF